MGEKRAADSATEMIHILRYQHLNAQRRLFGGVLMQWIDELAGVVCMRHCGGNVITAAVDQLVFKEPAFLGDKLVLAGRVTYTGTTSMEVLVDTYTEDNAGGRHSVNRAYLVMVAVDEEGKPTPVPRLKLTTEAEKQEWAMGEKRSQLRKMRRDEEF